MTIGNEGGKGGTEEQEGKGKINDTAMYLKYCVLEV